jgi:hypothetical protein
MPLTKRPPIRAGFSTWLVAALGSNNRKLRFVGHIASDIGPRAKQIEKATPVARASELRWPVKTNLTPIRLCLRQSTRQAKCNPPLGIAKEKWPRLRGHLYQPCRDVSDDDDGGDGGGIFHRPLRSRPAKQKLWRPERLERKQFSSLFLPCMLRDALENLVIWLRAV